jgi:AraC-like DNA-binding protein
MTLNSVKNKSSETDRQEFLIPNSYSRIIARELNLKEKDLYKLLVDTELHPSCLLTTEETYIAASQQMIILSNAQKIIGAPDFGLRLGRQLQPSSHGPIGYLVSSSPDVMTALESFSNYLPIRLPFSSVEISRDTEWVSCSLSLKIKVEPTVRRILQECFAIMIQSIVEAVLGNEVQSAQIRLAHEKPPYHLLYNEYLHSPVQFSQDCCEVLVPISIADMTNISENSDAYTFAQNLCLNLMTKIPDNSLSIIDKIRRILLSAPIGTLTADDVAAAMFITKRTLQRRLEKEDTTYREVLNKLHSELALKYLREPDQTIESIATLLGYFDTAAFRKAFHRWFGKSPREFKRNL